MIYSTRPCRLPDWVLRDAVDRPAEEQQPLQSETADAPYVDEEVTLWNLVANTEPVEVSGIDEASIDSGHQVPWNGDTLASDDGATIALRLPASAEAIAIAPETIAIESPSVILEAGPAGPPPAPRVIVPPPFKGPRKAA